MDGSSPSRLLQCRICHDEDDDSNLEAPCSCRGSLKYAHQKCVQRWCNEKGSTTCEICCQPFKPGYTAPSPLFRFGGIPMNFRGNWEMSTRDLHNHNPYFIAMVTPDHPFLDYESDDYPAPSPRSLLFCRIVAVIFMAFLVMRHTLPLFISGAEDNSFTYITLLTLTTVAILLPAYIMVKAFAAIQRRRFQQDPRFTATTSDEENELPQLRPPQLIIPG